MLKHQMRITVSKPGQKPVSITEFKKLSLFERLSSKWFGRIQKLMVIVSQGSIQKIEIEEV